MKCHFVKVMVVPIMLCVSGCIENVSTVSSLANIPYTFQALVDEGVSDSFGDVPGVSMTVFAPDLDVQWSGASGFDSRAMDDTLEAEQPFRIASVTKTFVAAAILRLHELGMLSVDDTIEEYVSDHNRALLEADGYDVGVITIRSCLNHTSGIYDYALGGRAYMEAVSKSPNRRWTREDQLAFAMEFGQPLHPVGERYSYSDSGYILLGEIIEGQVDSTLAHGLRTLLNLKGLGMTNTWLESIEDAPTGHLPVVHRYYRKQDYTKWDPSIDLWGGGGLVSTTSDLSRFFNSLFNNEVFDHPNTLQLMLEGADINLDKRDKNYKDYRLGVWHEVMYGMNCYMHHGIWDTYAIHIVELNCTIVTNYTDGGRERLIKKAALVIKNLSESNRTNS